MSGERLRNDSGACELTSCLDLRTSRCAKGGDAAGVWNCWKSRLRLSAAQSCFCTWPTLCGVVASVNRYIVESADPRRAWTRTRWQWHIHAEHCLRRSANCLTAKKNCCYRLAAKAFDSQIKRFALHLKKCIDEFFQILNDIRFSMLLQCVHGVSAFRYSALFRVVTWFNLTFPGKCSWCFRRLSAVCACLCSVFFLVHSFLSVSKGIRNKWLITPVETFSKILLAQSACSWQEHCDPLVAHWTCCRRTCQHKLWTNVPRGSSACLILVLKKAFACWKVLIQLCCAHPHDVLPFCVKKETIKKISKNISCGCCLVAQIPMIPMMCSEKTCWKQGVSRAGSRGRVLTCYNDTEQRGKEPHCHGGPMRVTKQKQ